MRQISSICKISLCFLLVFSSGCKKKIETLTVGEWISKIVIDAALPTYTNEIPYYLNIDKSSPFFDMVQASVEWGILDTSMPLNLDDSLTKEFIAYTLVNLMDRELEVNAIKDASKSNYPNHCSKAVSLGIFTLDNRGLFNPKEVIAKEEALQKLELVIGYINNYEGKNITNVKVNEDIVETKIPIEFDSVNQKAKFKDTVNFNEMDIITWSDGTNSYYKVKNIEYIDNIYEVELEDVEYFDIFDEIEIDRSFDLDFSNASISSINENLSEEKPHSYKIEKVANKEFEIANLNGTISFDSSGLQVKLKKKQDIGEIVSEIKIYKVKPTIRWKTKSKVIEDAYFKLNFMTSESLKYHKTEYTNYYSDFKSFEGSNLLDKLKNTFHKSNELDGVLIPICEIQVPIPNVPLLTLAMKLQMHLYTSGKVELILTNSHEIGLEIKNNKLRTFATNKRDLDFIMKASANTTLGFTTALQAGKINLMDIGIKGGLEGNIGTTVHLFDKDGNMNSKKIDIPLDSAEESVLNRDDVRVCGDIKANLILSVFVNSATTLANKIGLTKEWSLLNNNNASIIPFKKTHLENWQFMEKCTRGKRKLQVEKKIFSTDKIVLERVNYLINVGDLKKIIVSGLPESYTIQELVFSTKDDEVCSVETTGLVKGLKKGSCTINISTMDSKFSTLCHLLVS